MQCLSREQGKAMRRLKRQNLAKVKKTSMFYKKKRGSHKQINIDEFLLGRDAKDYDLIENVGAQSPSMTWPQPIHLS